MLEENRSEYKDSLRSIVLTFFLLTTAYLVFLMPVVAVGWGLWTPWPTTTISDSIKAVLASIYWWLYGVNFLLYLTTCKRIRDAYTKFFTDVFSKKESKKEADETSTWWRELRELSCDRLPENPK